MRVRLIEFECEPAALPGVIGVLGGMIGRNGTVQAEVVPQLPAPAPRRGPGTPKRAAAREPREKEDPGLRRQRGAVVEKVLQTIKTGKLTTREMVDFLREESAQSVRTCLQRCKRLGRIHQDSEHRWLPGAA